jgi:esterase
MRMGACFITVLLMMIVGQVSSSIFYQSKSLSHVTIPSRISIPKEPIVILHGLLGSSKNLKSWSKLLSEKFESSRDIICMDLRNHGQSFHGMRDMTYETMADDVASTLRALDVKRCHLIGHSMGGKVAAALALKTMTLTEPSIQPLSLTMMDISPIAYKEIEFENVIQSIKSLRKITNQWHHLNKQQIHLLIQEYFTEPAIAAFIQSNLLMKEKENQWTWNFHLESIEENLHHILDFPFSSKSSHTSHTTPHQRVVSSSLPTLILKGGSSKFVRTSHLSEIAQLFPLYMIKTVPHTGHWLHIEAPESTTQYVHHFLQHAEQYQKEENSRIKSFVVTNSTSISPTASDTPTAMTDIMRQSMSMQIQNK